MGLRGMAIVVAAVLLGGCASPATDPEAAGGTHPATDAPAPEQSDVPPCPAWDAEPAYPNGPLPEGAVSLRVCPGDEGDDQVAAIGPPAEALTQGVGDIVELVNARQVYVDENGGFCSAEGRPRIHFFFGYPDGTARSVTYGYGNCHVLEISDPEDVAVGAGAARADGHGFIESVSEAILTQRRGAEPPGSVPQEPPACVPDVTPETTLPTNELDLAVARLCVADGVTWRAAVLPQPLVRRLTREWRSASMRDGEGCLGGNRFMAKIVGTSTWGDPVDVFLTGQCALFNSVSSFPAVRSFTVSRDLVADLAALEVGPRIPRP